MFLIGKSLELLWHPVACSCDKTYDQENKQDCSGSGSQSPLDEWKEKKKASANPSEIVNNGESRFYFDDFGKKATDPKTNRNNNDE
jgi:hypothetical protein